MIFVDILYFSTVAPSPSRSWTLLIGYVLVAITLYWGLHVVLRVLRRTLGRPHDHFQRLAIAGTLIGVVLLALQSIGQLSLRDILVLAGLGVLLYLYSLYLLPSKKS